jgi:hypothetical protein
MVNCKDVFLREIEGREVRCAEIIYGSIDWAEKYRRVARLTESFSDSEYTSFLSQIDYEYDSDYGGQKVFGYIWYTDGYWSEREEFDGSEWWENRSCPEIPKELKRS